MTPRASIVIVTYGQRAVTERCLRSLVDCLGDDLATSWELVLVDNNSPDDTPAMLREWSDRATVRLLAENRNFAGGCNLGADIARGEVLVFLNNDTEVTPGALEAVVDQSLEPGVSVAGCRLLFPQGTLQHSGVAFIRGEALGGAAMPQHVFHHQDQELPAARASYECDCVTAACMAVRTTTFRAVGGFDEGYRNGLEDVDLCLRIRLTGERIVYRGDAVVVHHEGASRGRGQQLWDTPQRIQAMRDNDLRFVGRWATELEQDDELAARLWDAALRGGPPARRQRSADVIVVGQPGGIGPAGDEARALVAAFAARGHAVATADSPVPTVVPRLTGPMAITLSQAEQRLPVPGARWIIVPSGAHDAHEVDSTAVVRLARARTAVRLHEAGEVWACSSAVADAVIADGMPAHSVSVVPPPVLSWAPTGPGGGGVLAILPVHDPDRMRATIDALHSVPPSTDVRLLPTVATRHLDRHVSAVLPHAELLAPCSDEAGFAALAASADVVLAVDGADRFERRALVAASVGAAPITGNPSGPATTVLGDVAAGNPDTLGSTLAARLADPGDRSDRARRVERTCSPAALAAYLDARSVAAA